MKLINSSNTKVVFIFFFFSFQQNSSSSLLDGLLPAAEESGMGQENSSGDVAHGSGNSFPSPAAPEGSPVTAGWRYVSWLPSFSVEQSHTQLPRHHQAHSQPASTSQLDNLARQVTDSYFIPMYLLFLGFINVYCSRS